MNDVVRDPGEGGTCPNLWPEPTYTFIRRVIRQNVTDETGRQYRNHELGGGSNRDLPSYYISLPSTGYIQYLEHQIAFCLDKPLVRGKSGSPSREHTTLTPNE